MLPVFHLFGWFVPLAITFVAIYYNVLGNDRDDVSAGWCWIAHGVVHRTFWMLITGKAWEIAGYILISIFYAMLKWHIHQEVIITILNNVIHGKALSDDVTKMIFLKLV